METDDPAQAPPIPGAAESAIGVYRRRFTRETYQALRWTGDNINQVWDWATAEFIYHHADTRQLRLLVDHLDDARADVGDWVVQDTTNGYDFFSNQVFMRVFEPINAYNMPFSFSPELDGSLPLEAAVGQAIGAASVCWDDLSGAGVFHSDRAAEIVQALMGEINNALRGSQKRPGKPTEKPPEDINPEHLPFTQELQYLIGKHGLERHSGTSDTVLARYMTRCLETYQQAIKQIRKVDQD